MATSTITENTLNQLLIKDAPIPIATLDTELKFLWYSQKWTSTHNLTCNLIGENFFSVMNNIPKEFLSVLENCLSGNPCNSEGKKYIAVNGDYIWLKWHINPWKMANGEIGGIIIVLDNVTRSKNKEELLKEAQLFSRIGGWQVNLQDFKVSWTKMVNIIHEEPLDYVPKTYEECFSHFKEGEHRDKIYELSKMAITQGIPWDTEVKMITRKGNEVWIRTKGQAEFVNGKCIRIFGICQDVNERKIAELKYSEQAKRAQKATSASNVGVWEFQTKDRHTIWDDMCFKIHQVDPKKYENAYQAWASIIHPDDFNRVIDEAFWVSKGEGSGVIEYRILLPDKTVRHLKAVATFVTEQEKYNNIAIGVITDVTKEKENDKRLREYSEITSDQNDSLRNFAHMVSHDLRSHATNLSMVTGFLLDERDENEKFKLMNMLKEATESLNSTVHNLNEVVQSSSNVSEQLIPIPLKPAIDTVINNIGVLFKEKNAKTIINVAPTVEVLAIPAYLDSILLNLFTNSLRYSETNRPPILKIDVVINKKHLELTFTDNGKGIDLNKFGGKIFGMHKTFHRNKDARGVGLYITKNQLEAMGGNISVESQVGVGTTFKLIFKTQ
ncbi:PAS domain-containing protein [uncultured Maribacter sp.]|uniref:PAS domain-containing sensor histidine kinase n=1 Tax=uncultured Maribacter sp. TaxID=431308 RepID=UPI0026230796|nr:PAS domain-containing protein [uncultured Maribacter sp.]